MVDRIAKRALELFKAGRGLVDAFDDARHEIEAQEGRMLTLDENYELGDRFSDIMERGGWNDTGNI